jgi:hypothetical protein
MPTAQKTTDLVSIFQLPGASCFGDMHYVTARRLHGDPIGDLIRLSPLIDRVLVVAHTDHDDCIRIINAELRRNHTQHRSQHDDRQHKHRDGAEAEVARADENNKHQKDTQHWQDD